MINLLINIIKTTFSAKIVAIIILLAISLGYVLDNKKLPKLNFSTSKVHIYFDLATLPTMLQAVDLIQQKPSEKKYIIWRRYPNRGELIDLQKHNITELNLPPDFKVNTEGKQDVDWWYLFYNVQKYLHRIVNNHPHAGFVIHVNFKYNMMETFLRLIPAEQIEEIHLYEDGMANFYHTHKESFLNPYNFSPNCPQHLINYAAFRDNQWNNDEVFCLNKLFPYRTYYHISLVDKMKKQKEFQPFFINSRDTILAPIDFKVLKNTLSDEQKNFLAHIFNFDVEWYKQIVQDKKTTFFLGARLTSQEENVKTSQTFEKIKTRVLDNNSILFIKEHPADDEHLLSELIQQNNTAAQIFPNQVPIEMLIIFGLEPDYILGYETSSFYAFDPHKIKYAFVGKDDKEKETLMFMFDNQKDKIISIYE